MEPVNYPLGNSTQRDAAAWFAEEYKQGRPIVASRCCRFGDYYFTVEDSHHWYCVSLANGRGWTISEIPTDENAIKAIRLLATLTNGRYSVFALTGPSNSTARQQLMTALTGQKLPKAKCGVYAIEKEFYDRVKPIGDCSAHREASFTTICQAITT